MRAVGIAETALQKRPRPPYFDKPSEQSAGCRLVRTPKISAGIFSHLSALSPFALSGCGHRGGTGGGRILFHPDKHVGSRKIRPPCQIMRYFGRVLSFVSGGLFCAPSASVWAHGKRRLPYNQNVWRFHADRHPDAARHIEPVFAYPIWRHLGR